MNACIYAKHDPVSCMQKVGTIATKKFIFIMTERDRSERGDADQEWNGPDCKFVVQYLCDIVSSDVDTYSASSVRTLMAGIWAVAINACAEHREKERQRKLQEKQEKKERKKLKAQKVTPKTEVKETPPALPIKSSAKPEQKDE